jgi:hypothetical protein
MMDFAPAQYSDTNGASATTIVLGQDTALSTYHTVLQFPYDPTKGVYELDGTYGAILAMKKVSARSVRVDGASSPCTTACRLAHGGVQGRRAQAGKAGTEIRPGGHTPQGAHGFEQ